MNNENENIKKMIEDAFEEADRIKDCTENPHENDMPLVFDGSDGDIELSLKSGKKLYVPASNMNDGCYEIPSKDNWNEFDNLNEAADDYRKLPEIPLIVNGKFSENLEPDAEYFIYDITKMNYTKKSYPCYDITTYAVKVSDIVKAEPITYEVDFTPDRWDPYWG